MQTVIQVISSSETSLREAIHRDHELPHYRLVVTRVKRRGRNPGWSKMRSKIPGSHGAINFKWDPAVRILQCRVVTKQGCTPQAIIGDFVNYLLTQFEGIVGSINIISR
jgi:hypothetical protein